MLFDFMKLISMADIDKKFPFEQREIEPSHADERNNFFTGLFNPANVRYGPKGYLFTREYAKIGSEIYNMEVRSDDIFIVTFPKSGTTWTQELIWLTANGYDFKTAKATPLVERFPFIDLPIFTNHQLMASATKGKKQGEDENPLAIATIDEMAGFPSPRFIKSHLPMSLLPPKLLDTCKVVYVARDPRDVAVSFYHHHKLLRSSKEDKDFKTYWNFFIRDLIEYTPFFPHIQEAWEVRNHPNMLFLFYEELSKDLAACVRRVAKFLGKEITNEQLVKLCDHLHIDNFKKNKAVNFDGMRDLGVFNNKESFIRKGKVGGWRDYFDEEMTQQAELWMEKNLKNTDIHFPQ